jgi:hypothetical protein
VIMPRPLGVSLSRRFRGKYRHGPKVTKTTFLTLRVISVGFVCSAAQWNTIFNARPVLVSSRYPLLARGSSDRQFIYDVMSPLIHENVCEVFSCFERSHETQNNLCSRRTADNCLTSWVIGSGQDSVPGNGDPRVIN